MSYIHNHGDQKHSPALETFPSKQLREQSTGILHLNTVLTRHLGHFALSNLVIESSRVGIRQNLICFTVNESCSVRASDVYTGRVAATARSNSPNLLELDFGSWLPVLVGMVLYTHRHTLIQVNGGAYAGPTTYDRQLTLMASFRYAFLSWISSASGATPRVS